jgi:hypothetical protein
MKVLEEINGLVSNKIGVIKTVLSIFKLETRLAALSVYPLLLNICMLILVLLSIWFSSMLLLGYFILSLSGNIFAAVGSVLLINIVLFVGLLKYLSYNLQNMSFEKTREWISGREIEHHEQEKENKRRISPVRKKTKISREESLRT